MSLGRRSFLTLLTSGAIGLSLPPVEWAAGVQIAEIGYDLTTMEGGTAAILREMVARRPKDPGEFVSGAYLLGHEGLTRHWSIGLEVHDDQPLDVERYIRPAAHRMVHALKGYRRFGALAVPDGMADGAVATDPLTGLTVRGVKAFNIGADGLGERMMYRFDVLAGS